MKTKSEARREILDVLDGLEDAWLPKAVERDRFARWIVGRINRLRARVQ